MDFQICENPFNLWQKKTACKFDLWLVEAYRNNCISISIWQKKRKLVIVKNNYLWKRL